MDKSLSQFKVYLMNSILVKLYGLNPIFISVYAEERVTKEHILKRFTPDLIKSDLWFHILNFVYQRNLPHQRVLVKVLAVLRYNSEKNPFLLNMEKMFF